MENAGLILVTIYVSKAHKEMIQMKTIVMNEEKSIGPVKGK